MARAVHDRLLADMTGDTIFDDLTRVGGTLCELVSADGVGVWTERGFDAAGHCPDMAATTALAEWLDSRPDCEIVATDALVGEFGAEAAPFGDICGVLAIPIQRVRRDYLVFFRREAVRTIEWGGDAKSSIAAPADGQGVRPRKNFEAWQETVRGRSMPWRSIDLKIAETLRVSLLEIILRRADIVDRERREAGARQQHLIAELNHRVKNSLALIRSLVRQTRQGAVDVEIFATELERRIRALARAHDQLITTGWKNASLRPLLDSEAKPWAQDSDRISFDGPMVTLDSHAFQAVALVVHELMTNAARFGALTPAGGQLRIDWSLDEKLDLVIDWRESGGPIVQPPERQGFGSIIIRETIPFELSGEASIAYQPGGVVGRFRVPAAHVALGEPESGGVEIAAAAPAVELHRLLLVEDSLMIALDAQAMLEEGGVEVEVAGTSADAIRSIDAHTFDAAVLDINLSGETSFDLADLLRRCDLPFIFATGYGTTIAIPDRFQAVPVVSKPYDATALRTALAHAKQAIHDGGAP